MGSTFNAYYDGIGEMLRADYMQADMDRRAELGKEFAEATAPFDPEDKSGEHYRDHFHVEHGDRKDRASSRLVNDHHAAFQIEVGTSDTPAHRTLTRSLDVMGG